MTLTKITTATTPLDGVIKINEIVDEVNNKENILKPVTSLDGVNGTVYLESNKFYRASTNYGIRFILPSSVNLNALNQILVQLYLPSVVTVDVGTTYFFNNTAPNLTFAQTYYDLIYEYDLSAHCWYCGSSKKGQAS